MNDNIEVSLRVIICMVIGIIIGAAPPLLAWQLSGKFDPWNSLIFGAPYYFFSFPGGLLGAFIGICVGNYLSQRKKS